MKDPMKNPDDMKSISRQDWEKLFAFIDRIETTDRFGSKVGGMKGDIIYLPVYENGQIIYDFINLFSDVPFIIDFDWASWHEGKKMIDPAFDFDSLDVFTKLKVFSALIRSDRFSDGVLMEHFEDGLVVRVLKSIKKEILL